MERLVNNHAEKRPYSGVHLCAILFFEIIERYLSLKQDKTYK